LCLAQGSQRSVLLTTDRVHARANETVIMTSLTPDKHKRHLCYCLLAPMQVTTG